MPFQIDKRLDMLLSMTTGIDSYVLSTVVKDHPVPVNVFREHEEIHTTFFLDNISPSERLLFASFNPVNLGNVMEITERIDSAVIRTFSEKAALVPTIANGEVYTTGKNLFASFRFHSSDLKGAGKLVKSIVSLNEDLSEIQMTKSIGIVGVLDRINKRIPLSAIVFSFKKQGSGQYVLEWKGTSKDPLEGLIYDLAEENTVKPHSFAGEASSPLIKSITGDHIPLGSYLELHEESAVRALVHVPSCLLKSFLVRLYENLENLNDFKVESIEKYGQDTSKLTEFHVI